MHLRVLLPVALALTAGCIDGVDDPKSNTAPDALVLTLSPAAATTVDDLVVSWETPTDADGDDVTVALTWSRDDVVTDLSTETVEASETVSGETWTVSATPNDGTEDGTVATASVTIGNSAPSAEGVHIEPDALTTTTDATCVVDGFDDADGGAEVGTFSWQVDGADAGDDGATLGSDLFARGQVVTCAFTPDDGVDTGDTVTSDDTTVGNSPPVLASVQLDPAALLTLDTAGAVLGELTDADGDEITTAWAWSVDGVEVATTETLDGSMFVRGQTVQLAVTPSDDADAGEAVLSELVTVGNSAPSALGAAIDPEALVAGAIATCTAGPWADADGDPEGYVWAWQVDGVEVGTGLTLDPSLFVKGDSVTCHATPDDGIDQGVTLDSAAVVVANTPPMVVSVAIDPPDATTNSDLSLIIVTDDPDGDTVAVDVTWMVGTAVYTGPTLDHDAFSRGDTVVAEVTPSDDEGAGPVAVTEPLVIGNIAPAVTSLILTPDAPTVTDTIMATVETFDADGDVTSMVLTWFVDGIEVSSGLGVDILRGVFVKGNVVTVEVTPSDDADSGDPITSDPLLVVNTPPVVGGVTVESAPATEASTLTCAPHESSDADGDTLEYAFAWFVDDVAAGTDATLTGAAFDKDQSVRCTATAWDGEEASDEVPSDALVVQNTPPSSSGAEMVPSLVYTDTEVTCVGLDGADVDGDPVTWSWVWLVNGQTVANTETLDGSMFGRGDALSCRATASDGTDSAPDEIAPQMFVENSLPAITSAAIEPAVLGAGMTATCVPTGWSDLDGDAESYTYRWSRNGAFEGGGPTLGSLSEGDVLLCGIQPEDGFGSGAWVDAPEVVVAGTPPTVGSARITPSELFTTSAATCTPEGWYDADGDPEGYLWAWTVDGAPAGDGQVLDGNAFTKDQVVTCTATPDDGTGLTGDPVSSLPITVSNTLPVVTSATLAPTDPVEGDTIVPTLTSFDADGDTVSFNVEWEVDGALASTDPTLSSAAFNKNQTIVAIVRPVDDDGEGAPFTSDSVTAINTEPQISSAPTLAPANPTVLSTIVIDSLAVHDVDPADNPVVLSYTWMVGGVVVPGADGLSLSGEFVRGDQVQVRLTAYDDETSVSSNSGIVTVLNAQPTLANAAISPNTIQEGAPPTCSTVVPSDPDGDALTTTWVWTVNGADVATTATLDAALFAKGDQLTCTATVDDGYGGTATSTSNTVEVDNTLPTLGSVAITPGSADRNSTLAVAITGAADADGDSLTYAYQWEVNGDGVGTASTLSGAFVKGDSVSVSVTVSDDEAAGPTAVSPPRVIGNIAPVLSAVDIAPASPVTGSVMSASTTQSDADGDSLTTTYAWLVNGSIVASSATLNGATEFSKGDTIQARLIVSDDVSSSAEVASPIRTVLNTVPTAPVVAIAPSDPDDSEAFTCSVTSASSDADSDSISYDFAWTKNGASYTDAADGATSSTVSSAATADGDVFACTATPWDNEAAGTASNSASVSVVSSARADCEAWADAGYTNNGEYAIANEFGDWTAYCQNDASFDGGGWNRVVRTTDGGHNWGQNTAAIVSSYATPSATIGVYDSFRYIRDFTQVMIYKETGANAPRWSSFTLVESTGNRSLIELLAVCRDQVEALGNDSAWDGARVVGHTSYYSGTVSSWGSAGPVQADDATSGGTTTADYFFVCGVNESSDNDQSVLAFTDNPGYSNSWGDSWRGSGQYGTAWSFWNDDYCCGNQHIGNGTAQGYAGYKTGDAALVGEYSIWVR